ncbi:ABC transporter substrate-binding protein [Sulfurovum sp.]|uniref:ABC transporter substrate-binding protein n=1 Tax=Sulfurovum sp. TaxID=1969726 RepID=UPI0028683230|nr:ABC transporter substrate-binding protein [Sulfurovum sp.]
MKNLQEGNFDGAWLCFYNFEVIEAEHIGFEHLFIDQYKSPYANFSALELMTTETILKSKKEAIEKFIAVTNEMIRYLGKNTEFGKTAYYDYTKNEKDELMDKIIEDTITRFDYVKSDSNRWKNLCEFLKELEVIDLSDDDYDKIWKL